MSEERKTADTCGKAIKLLAKILDCGEIDIGVLLDIDPDILEEAVDIIKDKYADSEALNFPMLFSEAVCPNAIFRSRLDCCGKGGYRRRSYGHRCQLRGLKSIHG